MTKRINKNYKAEIKPKASESLGTKDKLLYKKIIHINFTGLSN